MLTPYRSVLAVPGSPRLLASALAGRLPQGMSGLAILLLVRGDGLIRRCGGGRRRLRAGQRRDDAGLVIAPVFSCQYALVGRTVTAGSETEAFTWVAAALVSGLAAGSAAGGAVISSAGVGAPFVLSCLATTLAAVLAIGLRRYVEPPARAPSAPDAEHSSARTPARDGWTTPGAALACALITSSAKRSDDGRG